MDETLPWYRAMPAEQRSWVGLVAQAGIAAFVEWFRHPEQRRAITGEIFGTAPRELARTVSLQQTVEMVRITIGVVEAAASTIAGPDSAAELREAVLIYAREVAFAAAQVYAQAAEARERGTRASRQWSSTPSCVARPTRRSDREPPRSAGAHQRQSR